MAGALKGRVGCSFALWHVYSTLHQLHDSLVRLLSGAQLPCIVHMQLNHQLFFIFKRAINVAWHLVFHSHQFILCTCIGVHNWRRYPLCDRSNVQIETVSRRGFRGEVKEGVVDCADISLPKLPAYRRVAMMPFFLHVCLRWFFLKFFTCFALLGLFCAVMMSTEYWLILYRVRSTRLTYSEYSTRYF